MSKEYSDIWGGEEHAQKPKFRDCPFFSEKNCTQHFAWFDTVLSYLASGENIIKLASKNSVKLGEKSTSNF